MFGAQASVRDNVRVLLTSMGYHCVVASNLQEALGLLAREKPDVGILDPQQPGGSPAGIVAAFHAMAPSLRGRTIVLTHEETEPQLFNVLDAYSLPKVSVDLLLQELWPCLDSLLDRSIAPRQGTRRPRLVFDSFLQPLLAGARGSQTLDHRLLYESESLMTDLWIERERDSKGITLVGQILDVAKPEAQMGGVPVVLQEQAKLIGFAATNEFGEFEFRFDFDVEPGVTLEMGTGVNHWASIELFNPKAIRETTEETQLVGTLGKSDVGKDALAHKRRGDKP